MKYEETMKQLVEALGGKENISGLSHCTTRLRFILKDRSKVDDKKVKNNPDVKGIADSAGQYQVIIGTSVGKAYKVIVEDTGIGESQASKQKDNRNIGAKIIDAVNGVMAPLVPAVIGCSMIKLLLVLLPQLGILNTEGMTYAFLKIMGDGGFYFLPLLVGASAAKKFGTNPYISLAAVAILVHPDFVSMVNDGVSMSLLKVPVTSLSYSYSVIPAITLVWIMSYIEKLVDKITPEITKNFLSPLLTLFISGFLAFTIVGPIGGWAGNLLSVGVMYAYEHFSWVSVAFIGAFWEVMVMFGMHHVFTPIIIAALASTGFEGLVMVGALGANLAQGGASIAVALKSKNQRLKQEAGACGIATLIGGITEPTLYGITLPLKKPMYASMIAGGVAGLFAGLMKVVAYSSAAPALVTTVQYLDGSTKAIIGVAGTCVIAIVLSFVLTWAFGFEDPVDEEEEENTSNVPEISIKDTAIIGSPLTGKVIPLPEVKDNVFSQEVLGKGMAVVPEDGKVISPVNGKILVHPESKHCIGMVSDDGIELLIHVGMDTVELNGKPFTSHVKAGDTVKKGDLLLEVDIEAIKKAGYDVTTPVIVGNTVEFKNVTGLEVSQVKALDDLIEVEA